MQIEDSTGMNAHLHSYNSLRYPSSTAVLIHLSDATRHVVVAVFQTASQLAKRGIADVHPYVR